MDQKEIMKHVDHTLLAQGATWEQIRQICDDAIAYGTASVCIPPAYVKQAKEYLGDKHEGLHGHRLPERLYDHGGEALRDRRRRGQRRG